MTEFFLQQKPTIYKCYDNESEVGYELFSSISTKFFEQFKYLYQCYADPLNKQQNIAYAYDLLKLARDNGFKNLDGSDVRLTASVKDVFGEDNQSNMQLFFLTGKSFDLYQNKGFTSYLHNTGLENFAAKQNPISSFSDPIEVIPYILTTDHNFYTEITNMSFLNDKRYDNSAQQPIYNKLHNAVYTKEYLAKVNLDAVILDADFKCNEESNEQYVKAIRTVNFGLRIFYSTLLIMSGFTDLLGTSTSRLNMIEFINSNWGLGKNNKTLGINSFHLHILNYLLSASHIVSYMITYCLYRDKYGKNSPDSVHTSCYLGKNKKSSFKDLLNREIKFLLKEWSLQLEKGYDEQIILNIRAVLYLASLWGVAYETEGIVGKNNHKFLNVDYSSYLFENDYINNINPVVRHNPNSPLWKLWENYAGKFWYSKKENDAIFYGKGKTWRKNKSNPRAHIYHVGQSWSCQYWHEYYDYYLQNIVKHNKNLRKKITKSKKRLKCYIPVK